MNNRKSRARMGIGIDQWKQRIGLFSQPNKQKLRLDTSCISGISLYIRIALFLLLAAQCIEMNPGPGGSGTNKGGANGSGRGRATPTYDSNRSSQRILRSSAGSLSAQQGHHHVSSGQPSISSWLPSHSPSQVRQQSPPHLMHLQSDINESSYDDLKNIMLSVQGSIKNMET